MGDKRPREPPVSASPCLVTLPSWPPRPRSGNASPSPWSLALSWRLSASLFELFSHFCPILSRVPSSGNYSIPPLGLWDLLPLADSVSPWWIVSRGREVHLVQCIPWSSELSLTGDLWQGYRINLITCRVWKSDHPIILTFIFLPPREV